MMKLAVTAAAALLMAVPALADDWDFILTNNSGKAIKTVELAPAGTTTWQANKIDPERKREDTVKSGGRMTVHFDKGEGCKYDLKLTFTDDSSSIWSAINVCDNSFVVVKYSAAGAPVFTSS